jgi:serine/alanine adding enzyme
MLKQDLPEGSVHYMQLPAWAIIKSQFGWKTERVKSDALSCNIQIYKRSVPSLGSLVYIPGLFGIDEENYENFTHELKANYTKKSFGIRLELNQPFDQKLLDRMLDSDWKQTAKHTQYRHTVTVDLSQPDDQIWMSFKSRGRYEILQAQKFGVRVVLADPTDENLQKMYELMQVTSSRNKFYIRDKTFTTAYWQKFRAENRLKLFFAWHDSDLLSGAIILTSDDLAWYKDGGSTRIKSNFMAARLLQWEAMKTLKKTGVKHYDLGGIPEPESHQTSSMRGIYVFKTAYSKNTLTLMPTMELPMNSRYKLWPKAEKQWLRAYNLLAHSLWW